MHPASVHLRTGETAVVGYGSLLSVQSLERTLGRPYAGPFLPCRLDGWRRSWDVSMPNQAFYYVERTERIYPRRILYLNVHPQPGSTMNGILFVLGESDLRAMDEREWIYDRQVVSDQLRDVSLAGGCAIHYVAKPPHLLRGVQSPREAAIRASYRRILDTGLAARGADFRAEFEASTEAIPRHLVIEDQLDEDRPNPWATVSPTPRQ